MKPGDRVYYVDWLRVIAVVLLVPFHTAMIFVVWDFHIKNGDTSMGLTYFNWVLGFWHMPLFMLLAGMSTNYAMGFRGNGEYLKERVKRLLLPFAAGMLLVIPPQTYFERLGQHEFSGSFLKFYPTVLTTGPYPEGNLTWNHLWFMLYLFIFSVVALPLFARLRRDGTRDKVVATLGKFSAGSRIMLPAVWFVIGQWAFQEGWPNGDQNLIDDWSNVTLYLSTFILGYVLAMSSHFRDASIKLRIPSAITAAIFIFAAIFITQRFDEDGIAIGALMLACRGIATWCSLVALIGFGAKYLNFTNKFLKYASEAALPFYILHQTVIITIGFYVIRLPWGIPAKFTFILMISTAATALIYELLGKRIAPFRFLLGMKPHRKRS